MKLYMFRTVPLSIISSLFTVHAAMVYVIQVCRQLSSRIRMELVFDGRVVGCKLFFSAYFVKSYYRVGFVQFFIGVSVLICFLLPVWH